MRCLEGIRVWCFVRMLGSSDELGGEMLGGGDGRTVDGCIAVSWT